MKRETDRKVVEQTVIKDYLRFHLDEPEGWTTENMRKIVDIMCDPSHTPSQPWGQADKILARFLQTERQRERRSA